MLFTIVNEADVFYDWSVGHTSAYRSSDPYDYLQFGYTIDNAHLFGGKDNVLYPGGPAGRRSGRR